MGGGTGGGAIGFSTVIAVLSTDCLLSGGTNIFDGGGLEFVVGVGIGRFKFDKSLESVIFLLGIATCKGSADGDGGMVGANWAGSLWPRSRSMG